MANNTKDLTVTIKSSRTTLMHDGLEMYAKDATIVVPDLWDYDETNPTNKIWVQCDHRFQITLEFIGGSVLIEKFNDDFSILIEESEMEDGCPVVYEQKSIRIPIPENWNKEICPEFLFDLLEIPIDYVGKEGALTFEKGAFD